MKNGKPTYYQEYDLPKSLSNCNFQKILDFYLFECPVPKISKRGKTFADYGFAGSSFSKLLRAMKKAATGSFEKNYLPCKKDDLEDAFARVNDVSPPDEYCVFLCSERNTVTQSLYAAIRHAFAHGSFNVKSYNGTRIYFLVNYHNYKKAQIVLHEETLLSWITLVQSGPNAIDSRV